MHRRWWALGLALLVVTGLRAQDGDKDKDAGKKSAVIKKSDVQLVERLLAASGPVQSEKLQASLLVAQILGAQLGQGLVFLLRMRRVVEGGEVRLDDGRPLLLLLADAHAPLGVCHDVVRNGGAQLPQRSRRLGERPGRGDGLRLPVAGLLHLQADPP